METTKNKSGFGTTFGIWFGIGAVMFGQMCGGASAAGSYAVGYWARYGGGWMIPFLLTFAVIASICCVAGLLVTKAFGITNYKEYYQVLWGVHTPGANPILKKIVTIFFDIYQILMIIMGTAACISLFGEMLNTLTGMPVIVGGIIGCVLFSVLSMYGAGFLRKASGVMTVALVVVMTVILACVIGDRGDVLGNMLGNFQIGPDWHEMSPKEFYPTVISYACMQVGSGATLASFAQKIRHEKDCVGAGIISGFMQALVFLMTSLIVLPYLPEQLTSAAPILVICQRFSPIISIAYWVMVLFAASSTAPTFVFMTVARFKPMWKSEKVKDSTKSFTIALVFLAICYAISLAGMMAIVQKGYSMLGGIGGLAAGIPLLIAIPRSLKKFKEQKAAAK